MHRVRSIAWTEHWVLGLFAVEWMNVDTYHILRELFLPYHRAMWLWVVIIVVAVTILWSALKSRERKKLFHTRSSFENIKCRKKENFSFLYDAKNCNIKNYFKIYLFDVMFAIFYLSNACSKKILCVTFYVKFIHIFATSF